MARLLPVVFRAGSVLSYFCSAWQSHFFYLYSGNDTAAQYGISLQAQIVFPN